MNKINCLNSNDIISFLNFYNSRSFDSNCFNDDGSLNKNYNSFKKTGLIATILEDYWTNFYALNHDLVDTYRPNAPVEIQKVIDCHNKNLGCSLFECPNCHDIIFVGHTCKSRICSSCGYKYKNHRVENILQTAYNCKHRQIVFTIPEMLRNEFYFPFSSRINILFEAVNKTIHSILNSHFKKIKNGTLKEYHSRVNYTPRFFCFLTYFRQRFKMESSYSCPYCRN